MMKVKFIIFAVMLLSSVTLQAQMNVFYENMGSAPTTRAIGIHLFQNVAPIAYSGTADVRNSQPSVLLASPFTSFYAGASGVGNVYFHNNTTSSTFQIDGINTLDVTGLSLSFGQWKSSTGTDYEDFSVEFSSNGVSWTQMTYTRAAGTGTAIWMLITPNETLPSVPNLRLRFKNMSLPSNSAFRIDDIKITGTPTISFANLQSPASGMIITGDPFVVAARVTAGGYTYIDGAQANVVAEIGYSSTNTNPSGVDWTWVPAFYGTQSGTRDEYIRDMGGVIFLPGTYYYASRFSISAGPPYYYGGYSGSGGGFWNGTTRISGVLTVIDSQVVYANLDGPPNGSVMALQSYPVTAQVYQPGITEAAGQGAGVQGWIGYSETNTNPNSATWSWVPATFNMQDGNNDEYIADIGPYLNSNTTFYYASRFQLGTGSYSYGGILADGSAGNFWDNSPYISGTVAVTGASEVANYYRSRASGSWHSISSWQSSVDNITWQNATRSPDVSSTAITIRNGHELTTSNPLVADDITIDTGGTLEITAGTFTLNNGASLVDLIVNGEFTNSGATFVTSGAISVFGKYNHATSIMTLPIATWQVGSTCNITGLTNSAQTPLINGGQVYHNFTFNNGGATQLTSILGPVFQVNGTMTLGPEPASYLLLATTSGTYSRAVNRLDILSGQLTVSGSQSTVTLDVYTDISVSGGRLGLSGGHNGRATVNVGNNITVTGEGILSMIDHNTGLSPVLNVGQDFIISGAEPTVDMKSTSSGSSFGTINILDDFICTSMSNVYPLIDFGTGTVTNNVINIAGDFDKTGDGTFLTSSANSAKGFIFNGTIAVQNFADTGAFFSDNVNYTILSGASVRLLSNLTIGSSVAPQQSLFSVNAGATLDFGNFSIIASSPTSKFAALGTVGGAATLITSNTDGFGGTVATGSLQNFADIGLLLSNTIRILGGVNYTFNGNTTTPYPQPTTLTSAGNVIINADVQSNMDSNYTILYSFTVRNGAKYTMNPTSIINDHRLTNGCDFTVEDGGIFDNGGENRVIKITGVSPINILGRFITRDVQGFMGTMAALSGYTSTNVTLGPNSIIDYGLAGDQAVQGIVAPDYQNVTLSNSGVKLLQSANIVTGTITVADSAIMDTSNLTFGSGTSNLTMTGSSIYKTGGSGTKPDSGGIYSLALGTAIEFYSPSVAATNPRKASMLYSDVIVSGNNIVNTGLSGLKFNAGGTFTVRNGGKFKLENPAGFNGAAGTAIDNIAPPIFNLEPGSIIEYCALGNQTITPVLPSYSNLNLSGSGIKSFPFTPEIKVGENLTVTTATLQIDSNVTMTVTDAVNNSGGIIDIKNAGSLVQVTDVLNATANNNSGTIRMERNANDMYRYDFTYWSSPVTVGSAFTIYDLTPLTRWDKYFKWNSATQAWTLILYGAENMLSGVGYIARAPDNFPTSPALTLPFVGFFEGTPNNGIVTVPTHGSSSLASADYKYNLLGNPYPSALFADPFISANSDLGGTLYFWTHNTAASGTPDVNGQYYYSLADYATYNLSGGTAAAPSAATGGANANIPSGRIAAGQGFFVRGITDGANTATFNNSMRVIGQNGQFFRTANGSNVPQGAGIERHRIWLNLTSDQGGFSQNLTAYAAGATNGIDRQFDGELLGGPIVALYSIVDATKLTSQGRALPFDVEDRVNLGYKATTEAPLQITLESFDGLFEYQNIYLEDQLLNVIHDIKQSHYDFTSQIGTFNDRFVLRFTNEALGNEDFANYNFAVVVKDRKIEMLSQGSDIAEVTIFDVLGRKLYTASAINSDFHSVSDVVMSQQVLIVNITLIDGTLLSRKIVY